MSQEELEEIYTYAILEDLVEKYTKAVDLKKFYTELRNYLMYKKFKDMLGTKDDQKIGKFFGGQQQGGEWINAKENENRVPDVYEYHFSWKKQTNGSVDFEVKWRAQLKSIHTGFGWYEFHLDLVCRNMKDVEILQGNNKITLQNGTYEFRNKILYKNSVVKNYLNKIPIIKNSNYFKNLYFHKMYDSTIRSDTDYGKEKVMPGIYKIIHNHFS